MVVGEWCAWVVHGTGDYGENRETKEKGKCDFKVCLVWPVRMS
jgi:hypothetical protein